MHVLPKVLTIDWSTWTQNRLENCNNSNGPVTPPYFLETVRKSRENTDSPETRVIVVNAITGLCMQFRSRLTKSVTIPQSYNWFLFSFPPPLVAQRLRSKFERVRTLMMHFTSKYSAVVYKGRVLGRPWPLARWLYPADGGFYPFIAELLRKRASLFLSVNLELYLIFSNNRSSLIL